MADRDLLERIDEHMARGNEHTARGNELMEQIREEHRLNRREHQLNRQAIHENRDAIRAMIAEMREFGARNAAAIDDIRDQIQANTRAVLAVLDERHGGGPGASGLAA